MKSNIFDPHKSFLNLKILWIVVGIHAAIALVTAFFIIYNSELQPSYTYVGLNNALNIFKIPLGVLALIIPIVALLAANHRSEQTKEQMRLASANNNFSNFYKHTEEFESYLTEHEGAKIQISLPRKFHRLAFPDAKHGDFAVGKKIDSQINWFLERILHASTNLNDPVNWLPALVELNKLIEQYGDTFYIKGYKATQGSSYPYEGSSIIIPDGDIKNIIVTIKAISEKIRDALLFDERYEPGELLTKIIEFDYKKIPSSKMTHASNFIPFNFKDLLLASEVSVI